MRLRDLQERLATEGLYYPPVPTYQEAMLGGTVSTNAGGAATFKYGVTRQWVRGLRVLLHNGDLLVLERGEAVVRRGESFAIALSDGRELRVPTPVTPATRAQENLRWVLLVRPARSGRSVHRLGRHPGIDHGDHDRSDSTKPPAVVTGLVFPSDTA